MDTDKEPKEVANSSDINESVKSDIKTPQTDEAEIGDIVNNIVESIACCTIETSATASDMHKMCGGTEEVIEADTDKAVEDINSTKENEDIKDEDLKESRRSPVKAEQKIAENVADNESERKQDCNAVVEMDPRMVEILKTISTYRSLALNKSAHSLLLKEDALIGQLVLFLGDDSAKVVCAAFEVVKILYHNRSNHTALKNSLHFLEALVVVSRSPNLPRKIRGDAKKIYDIVRYSKAPLSQSNVAQNVNPIQANGAVGGDDYQAGMHRSGLTAPKGNRSRNNDRETVISINPEALHHAVRRQEITTAVVKIKGIISVTYNLNQKHCIIRAKPHVPPEVFGKTIANLGIECYLVRRNENKEEVLLKMEADLKLENNLSSLEQENVPSYLPDDDDDEYDDEHLNKNDMVARGDEPATTVTGKISNFLRRSFFW